MIHFYLLLAALLLDYLLGEPRRWHPLVGFGRIVHKLEKLSLGHRGHHNLSRLNLRLRGSASALVAMAIPTVPIMGLLIATAEFTALSLALQTLLLYFCIGWRSLIQHALAVLDALNADDLAQARHRVAMMVSRDTQAMDEAAVARAATESVLENGSDALFAPIFWFLVGGAPAVLVYRLANTLDAMWGYRTERYQHFGWFAARLDDVLNFVPARLCAMSYSLMGKTRRALGCWHTQAHLCSSPNGGPVMTAGAGALNIQLGGPATYHGKLTDKPLFGGSKAIESADIKRACRLVNRSLLLWLIVAGLGLGVFRGLFWELLNHGI